MNIRKAHVKDVPAMHRIISGFAKKNRMLPRSYNELYESLPAFFVAEETGRVVGCCSLQISWSDLAEIKALAIDPRWTRKGVGTALVTRCLQEARAIGVRRAFCLTFVPDYFRQFGFKKISRNALPHKIWGECVRCPLFPDCGEIPMMKTLAKASA